MSRSSRVTDLRGGVSSEFSVADPTAARLTRNLFNKIEQGQAAREGVSRILYLAYVSICHELGHWFGCAVNHEFFCT